jgi:hypothetical protein
MKYGVLQLHAVSPAIENSRVSSLNDAAFGHGPTKIPFERTILPRAISVPLSR